MTLDEAANAVIEIYAVAHAKGYYHPRPQALAHEFCENNGLDYKVVMAEVTSICNESGVIDDPEYNLARGGALNDHAEAHDPEFKKQMDEGRARAAAAKAQSPRRVEHLQ